MKKLSLCVAVITAFALLACSPEIRIKLPSETEEIPLMYLDKADFNFSGAEFNLLLVGLGGTSSYRKVDADDTHGWSIDIAIDTIMGSWSTNVSGTAHKELEKGYFGRHSYTIDVSQPRALGAMIGGETDLGNYIKED